MVRLTAAPVAWIAGIAFTVGLVPLLVIGLPTFGDDTSCGNIFDDSWRGRSPYCHDRMTTWIMYEVLIALMVVAATGTWWLAYKRDDGPPL